MNENFPPFPFAVPNIIPTFAVSNIHNTQMQDARLAKLQAFFMSAYRITILIWHPCTPVWSINVPTAFD